VAGLDPATLIEAWERGSGERPLGRALTLLAADTGRTVDEAAWWFIAFEHSAHVQLLAEAAGDPIPADPDDARAVRDAMGTPRAAWFSFQPLYQQIVHEQPDVLH